MLRVLLMGVQYLCAFLIVSLVLLQRGKGADAGAGFGAGASGTVFGARGASTALSRATAILAAVFMITSLSLAYTGTHRAASSNSVLDQLSQPAPGSPTAPAVMPALPAAPAPLPAPRGGAESGGGGSAASPVAPGPAPATPAAPARGNGQSR
jgi:preprotein translocase subunit SecG